VKKPPKGPTLRQAPKGANAARSRHAPSRTGRRRALLVGAALVIVMVAAGAYGLLGRPAGHFDRHADQNVLLITIDTLRADALGAAGGRAATPNLDALAAAGIRFDYAHAQAVVTLPSHTSILTGLYPFQHGVRDNTGYRLRADVPTLATMLKQRGYATGAFVGAFPLDSRFGLTRGFDVYDDHYGETNRLVAFAMPERRAGTVVDIATRWLRGQHGKWFAWVHVFDPHAPYMPPPPFDAAYAGHPYDGEVAYVDSALGPLLALARQQPRPTLVVVTGDHGEALGSHGEETHGLFAYEATLKIPLIIDDTAQSHPFRDGVTELPARHVDIVPTVLDALSLPVPKTLPGRSLVAALERGDTSGPASYFEALSPFLNRGWAPLTGVLVGHEKFIDLPEQELYGLLKDPGETSNQLPSDAELGRVMEERLREFNASPLDSTGRVRESASTVAQLQALGYVSGSPPVKTRYTDDDDPKRLVGIDSEIHKGVELFQTGRPREALDVYRDIIRKRPSMGLGYLHAAFLQWELGQPQQAVDTLKQALENGASTGEIQAQLGVYLAESGSPEEAIRVLQPEVGAGSSDVDALNAFGIALARVGRSADAMATFERVLRISPSNARAWQNIGTIWLERKNDTEARKAFAAALALDPHLATALNGLGVVELRSGNRAGAIDAWKRAVAADPRQFDTLFNLGLTLRDSGDVAGARPYLEQFARTAPPAFYGPDIARVKGWLGGR
jgi:arylsulfatase A-like enzyme/tetratricopeptide (TPR) repeat protein